jgi:hypothetical protein
MENRPIMTADEILNVIRDQVAELYGEMARTYVRDLGELNGALFHWHWLYATATGHMDDFCRAMQSESAAGFLRFHQLTESNELVSDSENTQAILARWKPRGEAIGLFVRSDANVQ